MIHPTKVTIMKQFEMDNHTYFSGNWMEFYVGSNISEGKFQDLLDGGYIRIGANEKGKGSYESD